VKSISQIFILFVFLTNATQLASQYVNQVYTVWDDSFTEWAFETEHFEDGEWIVKEGILRLRYLNRDDWSERTYEHEGLYLDIKLKWKDNPNFWEMRTPEGIITAKTVWRNDRSVWRIQGQQYKLTLASKYKNSFDEWELRKNDMGQWHTMTKWEGDPRNWLVTDDMEGEVGIPYKVMFSFLVFITSINESRILQKY